MTKQQCQYIYYNTYLPMAFAALCPVVRISVLKISAVETHVTQLPIISNALAKNAKTISVVLFADPESIVKVKRKIPPKMYDPT